MALLNKWYMNLQVCRRFLNRGKTTRRFNNIFNSIVAPRDLSRISENSEAKSCKLLNTCQNNYSAQFLFMSLEHDCLHKFLFPIMYEPELKKREKLHNNVILNSNAGPQQLIIWSLEAQK
jgi:hypothetical protein